MHAAPPGFYLDITWTEVSKVTELKYMHDIGNFTMLENIFLDVLPTVHLSTFISVINQLDAQNLFHNKFYFMPLHVSSTCAWNM